MSAATKAKPAAPLTAEQKQKLRECFNRQPISKPDEAA